LVIRNIQKPEVPMMWLTIPITVPSMLNRNPLEFL
jgi:hypothetical protein